MIYGSINSDKFTYERIDKSSMRFRYRVFGSPNPIAEPVFQAVKPRRARNIWHYVGVTISCKGDAGFHKAKFEDVSGFPSHRLWINGSQTEEEMQGPLNLLWRSDPSEPDFIASKR